MRDQISTLEFLLSHSGSDPEEIRTSLLEIESLNAPCFPKQLREGSACYHESSLYTGEIMSLKIESVRAMEILDSHDNPPCALL